MTCLQFYLYLCLFVYIFVILYTQATILAQSECGKFDVSSV